MAIAEELQLLRLLFVWQANGVVRRLQLTLGCHPIFLLIKREKENKKKLYFTTIIAIFLLKRKHKFIKQNYSFLSIVVCLITIYYIIFDTYNI